MFKLFEKQINALHKTGTAGGKSWIWITTEQNLRNYV